MTVKMQSNTWRWTLGILYIIAVALIWIAASFVVQSVVDAGVSPFLITYICNSLFVIYIPIVEIGRWLEPCVRKSWDLCCERLKHTGTPVEKSILSQENVKKLSSKDESVEEQPLVSNMESNLAKNSEFDHTANASTKQWTRMEIAKVSLLICPFWFLAQLTFNLSLRYTTVTSNTILSSTSSLFTFLVSLMMLDEKFTWVKLVSVLLCMAGTIVVGLGDTESGGSEIATHPLLGDILCVVSAIFYALYTSLIRKKLPDEEKDGENASTAHFLGFLGLFNMIIFLPVALILHFTKVEQFHRLTLTQVGLIIGKGLLDNVFSDYLWAKAVLLTTPTVATAGLTIQVPLAALIDSLRGHLPNLLDYLGGAAVLAGFFGINQPLIDCCSSDDAKEQVDDEQCQHDSQLNINAAEL